MTKPSARTRRQQNIVLTWEQMAGGHGTLEACTGFGKTRVALMLMKRLMNSNKSASFLIVVPTEYLQQQWYERLNSWGVSAQVEIINTVVKNDYAVDVLILDEVHRYAAPIFGTVFQKVRYRGILGLTATLPTDDPKFDYIRRYAPVFASVSLDEALEKEWVSDFLVYNLGLDLTPRERREYKRINKLYHTHFSTFNHNFTEAMACLKHDESAENWATNLGWEVKDVKKDATQWIRNVQKRKRMLYNLDSKIQTAKELADRFSERHIIVFSMTQDFADGVAETLGEDRARSYHSGLTKTKKEEAIHLFRDPASSVHVLSTARALDQGADLPEIDMAIVLSGSSKTIQSIQRLGRAIRKHGDKRAVIVEVFARNTQDEKWLSKRQRKTPRSVIHRVHSIDDITLDH